METFLIKAAQLIVALAILVIIHEFGHFVFARIFGVKVEKFYIFFNPWTSLFKWKPRKYVGVLNKQKPLASAGKEDPEKKPGFWNDTEYGIGWLPLGGYCKIAGMIDESMDKEQMKQPAQPWEFRSKPAWQRLLIMIAGVLFNFLLAILIYAGITYWWGDDYVPFSATDGYLKYSQTVKKAGFQDGDIPLTADGRPLESTDDVFRMFTAKQVRVLRSATDSLGNQRTDTVAINLPENFPLMLEEDAKNSKEAALSLDIPVVVQSVQSEANRQRGLKEGDRLIAVDGKPFKGFSEFKEIIDAKPSKVIDLTVVRAGQAKLDTVTLPIQLDENSKIGFGLENDMRKLFKVKTIKYGLLESIPVGTKKGVQKMTEYVSSLKYVFTKEGAKSVGGFGAIGSMFPSSWNWFVFWNIAAFLSVALAFMNILPIPALDGGHVLFLLYEVIFRRKPSDKFLEYAQITGMVLLISLLLYANGMDIVRFFFK